ncbi:MAG TPA: hypothetical protein VD794_03750, partial [Flavisolibacter sp.]|nr:hypothetical protein [Flavisolibacter sp.]
MKAVLVALAIVSFYSFSTPSPVVELDLGDGFYYYGDSSRSHIHYLPTYKDTAPPQQAWMPKVVWTVIPKVKSVGYNQDFVLATNETKSGIGYWLIDKKKEAEEKGFKDSIALSNVQRVDSGRFVTIQKELGV